MQIHDSTALMAFQVRKKDAAVAFLLWWFLGLVGGHRYYCNRAGSATAMLLITLVSIPLCWVCIGYVSLFGVLIWAIVDAFSISSWVQQHNQAVMNQIEFARQGLALPPGPPSLPMRDSRDR